MLTIDIDRFVPEEHIDKRYYERPYYIAPDGRRAPDTRAMATNLRGAGVVGYNVQAAVDTEHHLIVAHDVTNIVTDRTLLSPMASRAKGAVAVDKIDVLADRGYFTLKSAICALVVRFSSRLLTGCPARARGLRLPLLEYPVQGTTNLNPQHFPRLVVIHRAFHDVRWVEVRWERARREVLERRHQLEDLVHHAVRRLDVVQLLPK